MAVSRNRLLLLGLVLFMVGVILPTCGGFVVSVICLWPHMSISDDGFEQNEEEVEKDVRASLRIGMVLFAIGTVVALAGLFLTLGAALSYLLSRGRQNGQLSENGR